MTETIRHYLTPVHEQGLQRTPETEYAYWHWDDVQIAVESIAANLLPSGCSKQDTVILGLSRGGNIPATLLSHALDGLPMYTAAVDAVTDILDPGRPYRDSFLVRFAGQAMDGKHRVIVVDDIVDSGDTARRIAEAFARLHDTHKFEKYFVALYWVTDNKVSYDLTANRWHWHAGETVEHKPSNSWVVFPWEPDTAPVRDNPVSALSDPISGICKPAPITRLSLTPNQLVAVIYQHFASDHLGLASALYDKLSVYGKSERYDLKEKTDTVLWSTDLSTLCEHLVGSLFGEQIDDKLPDKIVAVLGDEQLSDPYGTPMNPTLVPKHFATHGKYHVIKLRDGSLHIAKWLVDQQPTSVRGIWVCADGQTKCSDTIVADFAMLGYDWVQNDNQPLGNRADQLLKKWETLWTDA